MSCRSIKCKFKYCPHGGVVSKDEAVKNGKEYYHRDCLEKKLGMRKIFLTYVRYIEQKPDYGKLNTVIRNIVVNRNTDAEYVDFALQESVKQGNPPTSPFGIYSIVNSKAMKEAWDNRNTPEMKIDIEEMPEVEEMKVKTQRKGFGDILRR